MSCKLLNTSEAATYAIKQIKDIENTDLVSGLFDNDVDNRRNVCGYNEFDTTEHETLLQKFLEQFKDPMIVLLMISAGVSAIIGHFEDAVSIFFVLLKLLYRQ